MSTGKKHYGNGSRSNSHRRARLWSFLFGSISSPGVCYWCERHLLFERSTFDHVPPLSKGGSLNRGVISCYSCNHERRNKYDPVRDKVPDYLLAMREECVVREAIEGEKREVGRAGEQRRHGRSPFSSPSRVPPPPSISQGCLAMQVGSNVVLSERRSMGMHAKCRGLVVGGIFLCLVTLLVPRMRAEVFGVPTSDDVVIGTLRLKNGVEAKFRAREGTTVTIQESGQATFFGFVPLIQGQAQEMVRVVPFKIINLPDGKRRADEILNQAKVIEKGQPTIFDPGYFRVHITFDDITIGQFLNPVVDDPDALTFKELQALFGAKAGDSCCLTCGGVTVCADGGVTMSCGRCFGGGGGGRLPV